MPRKSNPAGARPRSVSRLLEPSSGSLGSLMARARRLQKLDRQLESVLGPELAERVRAAALRDGCLVVVTPSAALATRLRMDRESLLRALGHASREPIRELQVRVAPLSGWQPEPRKRRRLPESARQSLQRFAEDTGDETYKDRTETPED